MRGLAALIVVVSHLANAGLLPGVLGHGFGQMGVTLFYALSGFLLGHLYFKRALGRAELRRYAVNRATRVLPLFYLALAIAVLIFVVTGHAVYGVNSLGRVLQNALLLQGSSVLWSVSVEIQYYLLFIGLWYLHARRGWRLSAVLALGLGAQIAVGLGLAVLVPEAGTANLAYRAHFFLFGLALSQRPPPGPVAGRSGRGAGVQAAGLVVLFALALPELRRQAALPLLPAYIDPLTAGLPALVLVLALRQAPALRFLGMRLFRALGAVSFGLYLIHVPVIYLVTRIDMLQAVPGVGAATVLGLSLFLAGLSLRLVERPAQRALTVHFSGRRPGPVARRDLPVAVRP